MRADTLLRLVRARADGRVVGLMRIIIGIDCLIRAFEGWATLEAVLGWPVRFPYAFGSLPLSREGVIPVITTWMVAAAFFAAGVLTRLAGGVLATVLFYVLFVDQQTYSNHQLLLGIVVALLACADAGAEFSVERWWRGKGRLVAMWPIFLLRSQLSVVYLFSAFAKLNLTYMSGVVIFASLRDTGPLAPAMALRDPRVLATMASLTILVEFFLAIAFWSAAWRRSAAVVGILFHAGLVALMLPSQAMLLLVFGIVMTTLYLPFFDHEPRRMTIYYDDTCGICSRIIAWIVRQAGDNARFLDVIGTSDPAMVELTHLPVRETLVTIDGGKTLVRSQAVSAILRALPLPFQPLRLMELPGFVIVADLGYRLIAGNRHRLSKLLRLEACAIGNQPRRRK